MTFELFGEQCILASRGKYADGTPCLEVVSKEDGSPMARLTVCVPGTPLQSDEVLVKAWSENEPVAKAVLGSGMFEDTGKRVKTGFVFAQVWRRRT